MLNDPDNLLIQGALQLREHRGGTEQQHGGADHHRQRTLGRVARVPQHGLHHLAPLAADEETHLGHDSPLHGGALEDQTGHGHRHQHEGGE